MSMSKRDYVAFAEEIKKVKRESDTIFAAILVSKVCKRLNPIFDECKFFDTCGLAYDVVEDDNPKEENDND